jgi:hypothetical protein
MEKFLDSTINATTIIAIATSKFGFSAIAFTK